MKIVLKIFSLLFFIPFFSLAQNVTQETSNVAENAVQLIPNQGFTFESFSRGALGMVVLLLIAYIFSSNRKKINWKTVGIGLGMQILLAFGVLKVEFVQIVFEQVGGVFVLILDFTRAGSEFILGGLLDTSTYGFIFIFQILPTIIFFSAMT